MRKKVLWVIALVLLVPLITVGLGLVPINLSWLKADVSEWVANQSGLDLQIRGDLKLRLGLKPLLSAREIILNNPAEKGQSLLSLDQVTASPKILPFLKGNFLMRELSMTGASLDYCQRNFPTIDPATDLSVDQGGQQPSISVDKFRLADLSPECSNTDEVQNWIPARLDLTGMVPLGKPLLVEIQGIGSTQTFFLSLSGESLDKLMDHPDDFSFQGDFEIPDAVLLSLKAKTAPGGVDIERLDGTVADQSFHLTGQARDLLSRPQLEIDANMDTLDIALLAALSGSDDEIGTKNTDFQPLYDLLSTFDAKFKAEVGQVLNTPLTVDDLFVEGNLQDGLLTIGRAGARLDDNPVNADFSLDTQTPCAHLKSHLQTSLDDLGDLNSAFGANSALGGTLDSLLISTDSCGVSAADHLASLQATVAMAGLAAQWNGESLPLLIDSLESSISWSESGLLQAESEFLGETLSAKAEFGSMESLLSASRWPLDLELLALDSRLSLNGDAKLFEGPPDLNLDLDFEAPRIGTLHPWTGLDPGLEQSLAGKVSLAKHSTGLSLDKLVVNLGGSDLRGSLKWSGANDGRRISTDLRSEVLDLRELDLLFAKNTKSESTKPAAPLSREKLYNKWLNLPSVEILLSVEKVRGIQMDVDAARLQAHLSDRQIEDALLSFRIGDLTFDGSLETDFRTQPWSLSFDSVLEDIDIGYLLSLLGMKRDIDATGSAAEFQVDTSGNSLRELVENARTESIIDNVRWAFRTGPESERHEVELASLELSDALSSQSTWRTSGSINGVPFRAAMKTPPLHLTFDGASPLPILLAFETGQDVIVLDANVERENAEVRRLSLSVSGETAVSDEVDLLTLETPLAEYQLSSEIDLNKNELHFSNLAAHVGSSEIDGDVRIRYEAPVYGFDINLQSRFVETEDFVQWVADLRHSMGRFSQNEATETTDEGPPAGMAALIAANIQELAGNNRVKAGITIDELRSAGALLGETRFEMEISENEFYIDPVSIKLPDSHVEASFTGHARAPGYEYVFKADIRNLEYGGLLRLLDSKSEANGTVFLEGELTSHAPDLSQISQQMKGHVDMLAIPEDSNAEFLDLWASNLIFALLSSQDEPRKKMNCMVARFEVENGIMNTKNTFLDSTDIIVRARGDIDLVQRKLNLIIAPQAKLEKFLSVSAPLTVTGPFDDFQIKVAPGGFAMTMVRWFYGIIYVPWKWLTGERFPADGLATCYNAVGVVPGENP